MYNSTKWNNNLAHVNAIKWSGLMHGQQLVTSADVNGDRNRTYWSLCIISLWAFAVIVHLSLFHLLLHYQSNPSPPCEYHIIQSFKLICHIFCFHIYCTSWFLIWSFNSCKVRLSLNGQIIAFSAKNGFRCHSTNVVLNYCFSCGVPVLMMCSLLVTSKDPKFSNLSICHSVNSCPSVINT